MKTTKKQFRTIARDILVLLANAKVTKNLKKNYISLVYRTIAIDFALNFDGAIYSDYKTCYDTLRQYVL